MQSIWSSSWQYRHSGCCTIIKYHNCAIKQIYGALWVSSVSWKLHHPESAESRSSAHCCFHQTMQGQKEDRRGVEKVWRGRGRSGLRRGLNWQCWVAVLVFLGLKVWHGASLISSSIAQVRQWEYGIREQLFLASNNGTSTSSVHRIRQQLYPYLLLSITGYSEGCVAPLFQCCFG